LNIGIVGVVHRGFDHVKEIHALPTANIVALCDVDANHLVHGARYVTAAKTYVDFRDMLKHPELEAVVVSTPDHTHAQITAAALRAGKHVYCEKPLTHTVAEARAITELAAKSNLCTQLGIQIHAMDNYRRVVELIRAGAIGQVEEVHIWNNRTNRPAEGQQVPPPAALNYGLWLGPVPPMPFKSDYHPYNWRRYWAFGEGMLGDIGCHLMDIAFWALDLKYPTRISAEGGPKLDDEVTAEWIVATYDFPARGDKPAVTMTWYDPPKTPPMLSQWNLPPKFAGEGVMFIGEDGRMLFTNYGQHLLLPETTFASYTRPPQTIPKSPGHQAEWIDACLKNDPSATSTPFSYGGPLSETALLGTIAYRAQKPLEWDAAKMKFPNAPDAEKLLAREYRDGWTL
jgi:predicted dehydrogenase